MPIREIVKSLLGLTPYRIVRRRALPRDHDAVLHNRAENINQMFSGRSLPRNYLSPGRRMLQEKTLQLLEEVSPPRPEGGAIGDFGCGTGDFLRLVSDRYVNYELCGYDFSEVSLALARNLWHPATFPCKICIFRLLGCIRLLFAAKLLSTCLSRSWRFATFVRRR